MRFRDFVASRWPTPEDALAEFFDDAQIAAQTVGAKLDQVPALDGGRQYLPAMNGRHDKRQFLKASITRDPDGTAWPAITFKSWRHGGATAVWKPRDLAWSLYKQEGAETQPKNSAATSDYTERLARLAQQSAHNEALRSLENSEGQAAAASAAALAWDNASENCTKHPYLGHKQAQQHGLRVARSTARARLWDVDRRRWVLDAIVARAGDLLVPVRAPDGTLVNLQRIDAAGRKLFLRGARKKGCFYLIPGEGETWVAEGFATASSVHQATGCPVIVAFDAGNIAQVSNYASAIAADNDASLTGQRAAESTGLPWAMPERVGMDFNDVHVAEGLQAVRNCLARLQSPEAPEAPVFIDVFDLPQVPSLPSKRDELISLLRDPPPVPAEAAALAMAVAKRMAVQIPSRDSVESVSAAIRSAMPRAMLADRTVQAIAGAIRWIVEARRRNALSAVIPSTKTLARHVVERITGLPTMSAQDYRGVVVLRAPMGSGKTQRIGIPFARWASQQEGRFVALAHRQSLIEELAVRLDCAHYQRVPGEIAVQIDALATCLPSIVKGEHTQIIRECRWLFIDEISQVIRSLAARVTVADRKTMGNVLETLRTMIAEAECVIVADAGIDDRTLEFLESCRPGERLRYIESTVPEKVRRTVEFGQGPAALQGAYGEMLAGLVDGQRLWVACGEKSRAVECARLLDSSGRRVLLLTSDNAGNREQAQFLAEPDRLSRLYDAVVASPVISSGVSIEHAGQHWFDRVYLLASGATVTPGDALQQARRVRYVPTLSVVVTPSTRRDIDCADAVIAGLEQASVMEGQPARASNLDGLVADVDAGDARLRADFAAGLLWIMESEGYRIQEATPLDSSVSGEDLRTLRADISQERRAAILEARDLQEVEARRLRDRPQVSEGDRAALLRHRIVRDLGLLEPMTATDIDDWDDGRGPRAWDRWSAAVMGKAEASHDSAVTDLHRRRFGRARVVAYAELFKGLTLGPGLRVTPEVTTTLLARIFQRRQLLAVLGVVPAKWAGDRFALPNGNAATRAVGDLFERMGLKLKRREGTATPKSANTTLGSKATFGGGTGRNRWYEVDAASWSRTAMLADKRNAHRKLERVSVTSEDDQHWLTVRRSILTAQLDAPMAKKRVLESIEVRGQKEGLTFGARSTVFWLKHAYPQINAGPNAH